MLLEAALSRAQEIHQAMGLTPQFTRPSANGTNGNRKNGVHAPAQWHRADHAPKLLQLAHISTTRNRMNRPYKYAQSTLDPPQLVP